MSMFHELKNTGHVLAGMEIGEHAPDYENLINDVREKIDLVKTDFILVYTKPVDIPDRLWYEWACFFRDNAIYFAFLYTQQKGAPAGRTSHLTPELVKGIRDIAGEYYIGDMIGETGGLAGWQEGYGQNTLTKLNRVCFTDLQEAAQHYKSHIGEKIAIDRKLGISSIFAVEPTTLHHYGFQAGVDYSFAEVMCVNPEIVSASIRGACKAHGRNWWGAHIAHEWYGGFRNEDPLKYKRMKLAYYYSFLSGARIVYPESGYQKINSYGCNYDTDSSFVKAYRSIWNEFADFVHCHKRPAGHPKAKIGFVQGNLDGWSGWNTSTLWRQFGRREWKYDDAERSWDYLKNIFNGEKWHVSTVYGDYDATVSVPYGQYDIVPAYAPYEVLRQYDCLIFLGWNTMTEEIYKNLKQFVFNGGRLFMSIPHLSTQIERGKDLTIIHSGDCSDLFGCRVKGKGREFDWGVKFIQESLIPGYLYPYTPTGDCDPICASGTIRSVDIEITGGRVLAMLSDSFLKWKEESPAIIVENKYGEGFATLIAAWDYPGSIGLSELMQVLLRVIISGENKSADVKVISNDKIYYSVYEIEKGQYVLYLLNSDYNNSNKARICHGEKELEIEIDSCEIAIVYVKENAIKRQRLDSSKETE